MKLLTLLAAIFFWSGSIVLAQDAQPLIFQDGRAEIVLQDHLHHPFYWWPQTLVSYQVEFKDKMVMPDQLTLQSKGHSIPFQLTTLDSDNGHLTRARVHFLTDLASGSEHKFILKNGKWNDHSYLESKLLGDTAMQVSNGKFSVIIPTRKFPHTNRFSGPVASVTGQDHNMGSSMFTGSQKVVDLNFVALEQGPLFHQYRLTYTFDHGGSYTANLRLIAEMDFFELSEQMEGLKTQEAAWQLQWTGFDPTHRQGPNHPYDRTPNTTPGFGRYNWEAIDQHLMDHPQGLIASEVPGKMWMELGIFEPWMADKTLTSALFWDEKRNVSRGIFINRLEDWNDYEYSIWDSSPTLNVTFHYQDNLLRWQFPLVSGTRSTAISIYDHQKDIDYMNQLEELHQPKKHPDGFNYRARMSTLSWNMFLQNRYGTIHLDKIKDWKLTYPASLIQPTIFEQGDLQTPAELREDFLYHSYVLEVPVSGTRQNSGFSPVPARNFHNDWIDGFNRLWPQMEEQERSEFISMYLFHAYLAAEEEHMPMKHMLAGHPNFLADIKSIPAMVAFLFPDHKEAETWANLFEKYVDLNTRYHTRPTVESWHAHGGRWTENLGTYVWAFMRPTIRAAWLLKEHRSGKNRMVSPQLAEMGTWILNALSAPYEGENLDFYREEDGELDLHYWGIVQKGEGPRRVHPPQGAHAARRKASRSLWLLGSFLQNYDPLLAENLMYVSKPTDQDFERLDSSEEPFNLMYPRGNFNNGTPPDLETRKMTGYGNILRAGVNTPEELSVHLIQIDDGPNYRWGNAAEGGNGMIYYYAAGQSYSHNGMEDAGDRRVQDTDFTTNFGVFKDGTFRSVGRNLLHRPLYDLGAMQFAELVPDSTSDYSWPQYRSRSVMLIDNDYFITYDDVFSNGIAGRFSWFTHPEEQLPTIEVLKTGGVRGDRDRLRTTVLETSESKGIWLDGSGDFLVLVSHKEGFDAISTDFGAKITTPQGNLDYIFRNDEMVTFNGEGLVFKGTAGMIRRIKGGVLTMAKFHGEQVGNDRFLISTRNKEAGISAELIAPDQVSGQFFAYHDAEVQFSWPLGIPAKVKFYLDGQLTTPEDEGDRWTISFPAGHHHWQITATVPVPLRPVIEGYENQGTRVKLYFSDTNSVAEYLVETSRDQGRTWQMSGQTKKAEFILSGFSDFSKIHVRVTVRDEGGKSQPSAIYPVYFSSSVPATPDGLKLSLAGDQVHLNWGEVLGSRQYNLYRKGQINSQYELIYQGEDTNFTETLPGDQIYHYSVTAVNPNGESQKAYPANTDPDSWLNWDPRPWERFRRAHRARSFEEDLDDLMIFYPE